MVCKAVANALPDLPFLYVRDLEQECKREATKAIFERARQVAPCILALEDMDGLITKENRTQFLNEMDGFQNNEGMLIIASSNHPGRIDEALLKRPSRFDRVFHIGPPVLEERMEFCRRILSRGALRERCAPDLDIEALARTVAERTDGYTPAYLKEALTSAALQRVQDGAVVLDAAFAECVLAQVESLRRHMKKMKDPEALAEFGSNDKALGFRN
jgi:SpoVK/Ycf46/Vps4 family AAA+-type ATPase